MTISLRELQGQDLPRFAELERELFGPGAWNPNMIAEEVNGFGRWYVVAQDDEAAIAEPNGVTAVGLTQVVGYAGLWFDGDVSQVMTIGTDPKYQGRGVGQGLLQALVDKSVELGAEAIFLEVAVDNEPALALYRRFGFQPLTIRKRYYQPENKDAYTMRLQLQT